MKEFATHEQTKLPTFCSSSASLWPPHAVKSWQTDHTTEWPILFGMYHSAGDGGYGSALRAYETSLTGRTETTEIW